MDLHEQKRVLEAQMLACTTTMSESDAHASKCQKLGLVFQDEYPEDYASYVAANAAYHNAADELAEVIRQIEEEEKGEGYETA